MVFIYTLHNKRGTQSFKLIMKIVTHGVILWYSVLSLIRKGDTKMERYKIVRMYFDDKYPTRTIRKGLTLENAQEHCNDIQTSSSTCTNSSGIARTKNKGAWFDGYTTQ